MTLGENLSLHTGTWDLALLAQCLCEGPETNVYVGLGCTKDGGRGRWHRGGPSSPGGNAPSPRNNSLGHPVEVELSGPFLRSVGVVHFQGLLQTPQDQLLVPTAGLAASWTLRPVPSTAQQLFLGQSAHPLQ